jgi:hypothetical protein
MNLALLVRLVYDPKTPRKIPDQWRQQQRQSERYEAEEEEGIHCGILISYCRMRFRVARRKLGFALSQKKTIGNLELARDCMGETAPDHSGGIKS